MSDHLSPVSNRASQLADEDLESHDYNSDDTEDDRESNDNSSRRRNATFTLQQDETLLYEYITAKSKNEKANNDMLIAKFQTKFSYEQITNRWYYLFRQYSLYINNKNCFNPGGKQYNQALLVQRIKKEIERDGPSITLVRGIRSKSNKKRQADDSDSTTVKRIKDNDETTTTTCKIEVDDNSGNRSQCEEYIPPCPLLSKSLVPDPLLNMLSNSTLTMKMEHLRSHQNNPNWTSLDAAKLKRLDAEWERRFEVNTIAEQ